jgi:hypothetical protein
VQNSIATVQNSITTVQKYATIKLIWWKKHWDLKSTNQLKALQSSSNSHTITD